MLVLVVVVVLVALALRLLVAQAYLIPSGSMQPLLQPGDRVLVLTAGQPPVHRGDVVVFDGTGLFSPTPPQRGLPQRLGDQVAGWFGAGPTRDVVKRVVGLPGERITCCDDDGRLSIDGVALDEPYLMPGDAPSELAFDVEVPQDRLWMMGDHRSDSADSRAHLGDPGGGMVPVDRVVGRVVAVLWPPGRVGGVDPGEGTP